MSLAVRLLGVAGRLLLIPPMLIFFSIAFRHVFHPSQTALAQGMVLSTQLGTTSFRAGLGGFPLACALYILYCACRRGRVLAGLVFAELVVCTVLGVRIGAMLADNSVSLSLRLVMSETVLAALTAGGIFLEVRKSDLARPADS